MFEPSEQGQISPRQVLLHPLHLLRMPLAGFSPFVAIEAVRSGSNIGGKKAVSVLVGYGAEYRVWESPALGTNPVND